MGKAPAGGIISRVNGQFYKGGEFTPETGEFCGRGKDQVTAADVAAFNTRTDGWRVVWDEKTGRFGMDRLVTFSSGLQDWQRYGSGTNFRTLVRMAG